MNRMHRHRYSPDGDLTQKPRIHAGHRRRPPGRPKSRASSSRRPIRSRRRSARRRAFRRNRFRKQAGKRRRAERRRRGVTPRRRRRATARYGASPLPSCATRPPGPPSTFGYALQGRAITLKNIGGALSPKSRHCNHSIAVSRAETAAQHTQRYNREEEVVEKGTKTCTQGPCKYTSRPMLPGCSIPIPADRSSIGSDSRKLRLLQ